MPDSSGRLRTARRKLAARLAQFNDFLTNIADQVRVAIGRALQDAMLDVIRDTLLPFLASAPEPAADPYAADTGWQNDQEWYEEHQSREAEYYPRGYREPEPTRGEPEPVAWRAALAMALQTLAWFVRQPLSRYSLLSVLVIGFLAAAVGLAGGSLLAAAAAGGTALGLLALVDHLPASVAYVQQWLNRD